MLTSLANVHAGEVASYVSSNQYAPFGSHTYNNKSFDLFTLLPLCALNMFIVSAPRPGGETWNPAFAAFRVESKMRAPGM